MIFDDDLEMLGYGSIQSVYVDHISKRLIKGLAWRQTNEAKARHRQAALASYHRCKDLSERSSRISSENRKRPYKPRMNRRKQHAGIPR